MAKWNNVKISSFLKERIIKYKPQDANNSRLQRIVKIDFSGKITLSDTTTQTDMILIKHGDLVISGINVEKGAMSVYDGAEDILASIHYSAYEYDDNVIDIEYLKWYLKSSVFKKILVEQTGSGIKTELKAKKLLSLVVKLPQLTDQKKIVKYIVSYAADSVALCKEIDKSTRYISKLRQSILQQAIEGKLCPQDSTDEPASELLKKVKAEKEQLVKDGKIKKEKPLPPIKDNEKPFALPQGWEWCRFGKVINISSNLVSPNQFLSVLHIAPDNIEKANGKLKFCRIVSEDNVISNNHYFKSGQIIYSKIRPKLRKVVIAPFDGLCSADMYPIDSFISTRFTFWYMLTDVFTEQVTRSDNRVKMPKTNQNDLSRVLVPVPPMQEQQRSVQKVDSLMSYCDELEKQITKSKDNAEKLMQSILAKAFNDQEEKQPAVIVAMPTQVKTQPVKLAARGSISAETMQHIEQTINEMCGES